jgi:putative phage-type endonuclease
MTLTPQQLERRRKGLGSSDIATVAGLNPFRRPLDVWLDKTGKAEPTPESMRMHAGNLFEPVIVQWYAEERGGFNVQTFESDTLVHPDEEWRLATPDRFVDVDAFGRRLVEAKLVGPRVVHHWRDGAPDYVVAQVQWQEDVSGIHQADIAAALGGVELIIEPCPYVKEIADDLVEIGRDFWFNYVLPDKPPPVDASESYRVWLQQRWPESYRPLIDAPPDAKPWVERLHAVKGMIADLEAQQKEAESHLKVMIGDASGMQGEGWRITWKHAKSGGTDWKGLAGELGATDTQIEAHERPGARKFNFKMAEVSDVE